MRTLLAHRPSPAMIVACVALLVALGGTSVAAVTALAPNSVGTVQLKTNAVIAAKIRNANVTGAKVANERDHGPEGPERLAVSRDDFAAGLPSCRPRGPRRPRRPSGSRRPPEPSARSPCGRPASSSRVASRRTAPTTTETVTVNCNANEKAISAGTGWSDDAADRELWTQRITPIVTNNAVTGYRGTGGNDSGNSSTFTLYVLCYAG